MARWGFPVPRSEAGEGGPPVEQGVKQLEELADLVRGEWRRAVARAIDESRRRVDDEGEPVHNGLRAGQLRAINSASSERLAGAQRQNTTPAKQEMG